MLYKFLNIFTLSPYETSFYMCIHNNVSLTCKSLPLFGLRDLYFGPQISTTSSPMPMVFFFSFLCIIHGVYPIISPSRVSHFLSLGFETFFLGPQISPTSSLMPIAFFYILCIIHRPLIRHPFSLSRL